MLPARDMAEFTAFPDSEVAWINRWLNFTDKNQDLFQNLVSVATLDRGAAMNGGKPAVGFVDGTAAFDEDNGHGVVFLFNPGPRPVPTVLTLDESLGIKNSSSSNAWQVSELYPREVNGDLNTPIAVQPHSGSFSVTVSPLSACVLSFSKTTSVAAALGPPLTATVLNLSHTGIAVSVQPEGRAGVYDILVNVTGAVGLAGETYTFETIVTLPPINTYRLQYVHVDGRPAVKAYGKKCTTPLSTEVVCMVSTISFQGSSILRTSPEATDRSPPNPLVGEVWFNSTLRIDEAVYTQLQQAQIAYPVPWGPEDIDAPWLGNRLLLYVYITQPDINRTRPSVYLDGVAQEVTPAYNSRGNIQNRCFLGFYVDATSWGPEARNLSVWVPRLNGTSEFLGVFWNGLTDAYSSKVVGPLPGGNLTECARNTVGRGKSAPKGAKSVLWIVVDDLRPQLGVYNVSVTHTPRLDSFARKSTVFDRAYTQIAVCSPSRNSFLSGLRPQTTGIYNFINHVRQANCGRTWGQSLWSGTPYRNISIDKTQGAAGECCTQCTGDPACAAWTYVGNSVTDGLTAETKEVDHCSLYESESTRAVAPAGVVSGSSGFFPTVVSLPQHFKSLGYLVMQSGKIWHTEEGGLTGVGMPPLQDFPLSWSAGCSMAAVNEVAPMNDCDKVGGTQGCPIDTDEHANPTGSDVPPLCDKTIADDALQKLAIAKSISPTTPFFLAVGFRYVSSFRYCSVNSYGRSSLQKASHAVAISSFRTGRISSLGQGADRCSPSNGSDGSSDCTPLSGPWIPRGRRPISPAQCHCCPTRPFVLLCGNIVG